MVNVMFISIHLQTLGCDTTSKGGIKRAAYEAANDIGYGLLHSFRKEMITEEMVRKAEQFLVHCIAKKHGVSTFDDLR